MSYDALRLRLELPVSAISPTETRGSVFSFIYDLPTIFPSSLRLMASHFRYKTRLQLTCFSRTFFPQSSGGSKARWRSNKQLMSNLCSG